MTQNISKNDTEEMALSAKNFHLQKMNLWNGEKRQKTKNCFGAKH